MPAANRPSSRFVGPALILVCTVIWGAAFVAQKLGADHFGPFAICCYRNLLAGAFLAAVVAVRSRLSPAAGAESRGGHALAGGILTGVVLFLAMLTQQLGIETTTPGISAFLTANYLLIVPFLAWAVGRGRPSVPVWCGVALALCGSFLISVTTAGDSFGLGRGEAWSLVCAALFAVQIILVDRFARRCDVYRFSMIQMFAAGVAALPFVFLPGELARASWSDFAKGLPALLYVGIFSSGIAYTLQNLGQARTPPALAVIVMSLESVFGALSGWLVLGDTMTVRQLVGCGLVLAAVLLTQLVPHLPARRCCRSASC